MEMKRETLKYEYESTRSEEKRENGITRMNERDVLKMFCWKAGTTTPPKINFIFIQSISFLFFNLNYNNHHHIKEKIKIEHPYLYFSKK